MITRTDIKAHLDQSARVGFTIGQKGYTPLRSAFAQQMSSSAAYELLTDLGALPWPVQNGGKLGSSGTDARTGAQSTGDLHKGAQPQVFGTSEKAIMVFPIDWEITIGVTHNSIDDDKTGDLTNWASGAALNFQKHMDWISFAALNAGDATTYGLCYDGLYMFSNSHVDPGAEYTTVQDNLYALTLTLDNLRTVKVAASKFMDDRGKPKGMNHNLLIVPPDLEYEAAQITRNPQAYDTANRELNPYSGSISMLVAPGGYLDTTAWFMVDPTWPVKPIILIERKAPALSIWDQEDAGDGGVRWYKWHARYNVAYGDWRLAIMGNS